MAGISLGVYIIYVYYVYARCVLCTHRASLATDNAIYSLIHLEDIFIQYPENVMASKNGNDT